MEYPMQQHSLGTDWIGAALQKRSWGSWWTKLSMVQQCDFVAMKANTVLVALSNNGLY